MKKDYHALPSQDITAIFDALKNNSKYEQYNFEVKKGGNSVDEGQLCGMLNSEGGLIIVGIEEIMPKGSGYNLCPISDLKAENGKIKTQIEKLMHDNLDVANIIKTCCIVEPFSYEGGTYLIVKVNPSDVGFVFDGRVYYKIKENKDHFETRKEIIDFMGKIGDYSTFVYKINSFKVKLSKISQDSTVWIYLPSFEIEEIRNIIGNKSIYVQTKIDITTFMENLMDLQMAIQFLENSKHGSLLPITATALNVMIKKISKKDATTVLNETIDALDKISAS